MTDNIDIEPKKDPGKGRAMFGIILLLVGCVLLLREFDYFFLPSWLFSWPMWLIGWGLFAGARSNFKNQSWVILVLLGIAFLIDQNFEHGDRFVWPAVIIAFGFWMIVRRNHRWDARDWGKKDWNKKWEGKWDNKWGPGGYGTGNPANPAPATATDAANEPTGGTTSSTASSTIGSSPDDYLDTVSVFGGVNKTILSKSFKGGDIVNIFGGTELDFTQADINGRVIVDITQIFGGTKIIIPSNWHVVSDIAAVFAGVDDKRLRGPALDDNKILVLKGVSLFAGIDIRSY